MACTKETYTLAANWTDAQFANLFRDAFIDAGLMTDWYDSFATDAIESIEMRILEVTHDATKVYGKTYYWFSFQGGSVYVDVVAGWDAINSVPAGTQFLDFFATTAEYAPYQTLYQDLSRKGVKLARYTSGEDPNQSWFTINDDWQSGDSGVRWNAFTIVNDSLRPWINLDKGFYNGFAYCLAQASGNQGLATWETLGVLLRRDVLIGSGVIGPEDGSGLYGDSRMHLLAYRAVGSAYGDPGNYENPGSQITLPVGFSDANPAYVTNSNPVFHSLTWNPYIINSLPSDFGIAFHYANGAFDVGDTFVVSPGVEEWETLNGRSPLTWPSEWLEGVAHPLFLARVV
jgi:hypothetical protein